MAVEEDNNNHQQMQKHKVLQYGHLIYSLFTHLTNVSGCPLYAICYSMQQEDTIVRKKNTHSPCLPGPTGLLGISQMSTFCIVMKLEGSTESNYLSPVILEVKKQKLGVTKSFAGPRMHLILDYMLLVFF